MGWREQGGMRRRLLSITIESFDGPAYADRPLPFGSFSRRLVEVLTADPHRYEPVEPPERLDAESVGAAIKQAVRGEPGDVVIVHVVSHAEGWGDDLRVVGADGRTAPESSVRSWLDHANSSDRSPRADPDRGDTDADGPWVLFLLDLSCTGGVVPRPWQGVVADEHRRVWTVADQSAFNARLTQATAEILADLGALDVDPTRPYVPLPVFQEAVDRWGQDYAGGGNHRVTGDPVDVSVPLDLPFLVNPNHSDQARVDGAPDLRAYVSALDEIVDPWHFFTGSGTAPTLEPGHGRFHGRDDELRRLTAWLTGTGPHGAATTLLVTGRPGVGKSALFGLLVCSAHPKLRDATEPRWRHRAADLPEQPVTDLVAVHAQGRTTDEVMDLIGRQCDPRASVSSVDHLVDLLSWQPRPPVIVIDAVDEAVDPTGLVDVLQTLGRAKPVRCRLLIGARTGPLWPDTAVLLDLAGLDNTIDLDRVDRDALRHDLTAYADGMLELHPRYRGPDYVDARRAIASTISQRLTESAAGNDRSGWGEFLLAGLFIHSLRHRDPVRDAQAAQAIAARMPVTLSAIIGLDLDPYAQPLARAVLTTLAHSFGDGLPRILLRDCVPVFAGRPVTADEIADALDWVSFYVRRGVDGRGVRTYRPFHHAITEHLGNPPNRPPTAEGRQHHGDLLSHLLARLRSQPDAAPDWSAANPYVLRHAIDHAARAGRVDDLLTDPEFLVHAEPTTLRLHLPLASSEAARANAAVYHTTVASQAPALSHRRGLLRLDAARQAHTDPVTAPDAPTAGVMITPRWASLAKDGAGHRHTLAGHGGQVWAVATTALPDGTPVAVTASIDTTARVWDLTTGQARYTLTGHSGPVTAVATMVLPDETPVAVTTSADGTARVWDLITGRARHTLAGHADWVQAVATMALPDGTPVAVTASHDQTARVWDLTTGQARHVLTGHSGPVTAVATVVLPDGSPVAVTASDDTTVRVWDLTSGQARHILTGHMRPVRAVATVVLPDGTPVAATTGDDTVVRVWDVASGDPRHILTGHTEPNWAVAMVVLPDGTPVAVTTSIDGTGRVWDLTRGRSRQVLAGHTSWPRAVATVVLPDGTPVAVTASDDATARVWDLTADGSQPLLTGHTGLVESVAAVGLPDGSSVVVSTSADRTVRVWDLTTGRGRHILTGHTDSVGAVATLLLPDGTPVAVTTSVDATARVWDLASGELRHILAGHTHWVYAVATLLLPDGTPVAVTTSVDATARVWDLASGQLRRILTGHTAEIEDVATMVLPDGTPVAVTTSLDATARIWDLATGQTRHVLTGHGGPVRAVATVLLPDGTPVVVTSSDDATARVWDLTTGQHRHTLAGHPDALKDLVTMVLPDGTPVAVGSGYGETARVWDLTNGELRHVLAGHTDWAGVEAALLLPDGTPVAITIGLDATARLWDLTNGHQLAVQPTPCPVNALCTLGTSIIMGFDRDVACFDIETGPAP